MESTLRRALFEQALAETQAAFKGEGHVGVDLMELPPRAGHVGEGRGIMEVVLNRGAELGKSDGEVQ